VLGEVAQIALSIPDVHSVQTYAGEPTPFNFNGLVRHYYIRTSPELGDVQITLAGKEERDRTSHQVALELREKLKALSLPDGASLKVVEPPPGPPVLATLLAEIYGPDAETRRATAAKVREAFASVPFVVDIDDSYGQRMPRIRIAIDQDNLEYQKVEEGDVYDTLQSLYAENTVGYSHRGGGRQPIPITLGLPKPERVINERTLSTPVPANALPGGRGVVELGDVVSVTRELSSYPLFRHNGKPAEMVTAELAGSFEAPVYGMIEVGKAIDAMDWTGLQKPVIALHGQPIDDSQSVLLWDGEWEVTWVTFRDMGGAFLVALLGIYILVVAQFGSFKLPLVILTPIPLTLIGIMVGHWMFNAAFTATSMIGFIALAGIIVRNSILLVDFVKHSREPGDDLRDVLLKAGAIRFKPILLTAIAAMIGAAVILADPIFQGLAISLLFGLASSTLLTVLVIPAIYMALRYKPRPTEPHVPAT
jgi:multidrug efflux pump subunit AcrB